MAKPFLESLDGQLDKLFAGWNIYSTVLTVVIIAYLFSPLFFSAEADAHPIILAHQSSPFPVRQPGESAVYRALEVPHGYPLRSGLNVKDEGASKWAAGRDGDLRDIWKEALKTGDGAPKRGQIFSVKGRDKPIPHELDDLTKEINVIGKHIQAQGGRKVAIYLPNSVEFLVALLSAAFYGFTPILIPQMQSLELLGQLLRENKADVLIAPAGTLSPEQLASSNPDLKHFIWVAEKTSRHMDWLDGPKIGGNISEWRELVDQYKGSVDTTLPVETFDPQPPSVITVWQNQDAKSYEIIEYSQANIIAAVAAQISVLPRNHRIGPSDLLLSLESLTQTYPLTITLAALFSHASLAFTSVGGSTPDFDLAFQSLAPTIVIASAGTLARAHTTRSQAANGLLQKLHRSRQASALAAGTMRAASSLAGAGPRLVYTSGSPDSVPLSPRELNDLRVLTGARIVYALTVPRVAGAVAQTNVLDYRITGDASGRSHFGPPLGCVEVKVVDAPRHTIGDDEAADPVGHFVVSGPAVVGGEVNTGVLGKFAEDCTVVLK